MLEVLGMKSCLATSKKLHRIIVLFSVVFSIILCAVCLVACNDEKNDPSVYTADELKYVSESGVVMCETRDRKFYKAYSDPAVYGYIITEGNFENGNIGPLLIGKTSDSVAYYTSISRTIFTNAETIEYKGETYYYSVDEEFCYTDNGWKHNGSSHLSMYVCKANDRKSGAEEIIKIANLSKLETDGGLLKSKEHVGEIDKTVYEFGGHYYGIFDETKDWLSAELYCESIGGHLVTITSSEEDKFVHALITDVGARGLEYGSFRIGGNKIGDAWTWITKEKFEYSNFGNGQPDGSGNYLSYWFSGNEYQYKWDDCEGEASVKSGFICEWKSRDLIGSSVDYYPNKITNVAQLKAIAGSNQTYALGADIDLSGEEDWSPINGFSGRLIGNGRKILNLTINAVNVKNIGLFSELTGTVQDLIVENAQITARGDAGYAGIIAGTNCGVIKGVTVSGTVNPTYYSHVGGLVGYNNCGTINDCVNQATVVGVNNIGGIAGVMTTNANGQIDGNINEGEISGTDNVGGIVGYLTCVRSNATYLVSDNTNRNTVTGSNRVGGIFGEVYAFYERYDYKDYNSYFSMSLLVNQAEISGKYSGNHTGGLIGKATRLTVMTTCENTGDVSGGAGVGGFVGYAPDTNIKASGAVNNNKISGRGVIGGVAGRAGIIEYATNNGDIISSGEYVENGVNLAYTGGIAGFCTGLIGCENNSDISVKIGMCVGGLAGYVVVSESNRVNTNINTGAVTGTDNVGGIVGYLTCVRSNATYLVSDNTNKNTVTGLNRVGGIFGEVYAFYERYDYKDYNSYFSMSLLVNQAEISGKYSGNDTGGLIGKATRLTVMTTCENTADVSGGICVGGFVGYAPDTNIKAAGVVNNNTITGNIKVGGFAGHAGIIEYAVNNGEIVATGKNESGNTFLGGVAGYCAGAIGCENNVDIALTNNGRYVGGIAGYILLSNTNAVHDNANNGSITGGDYTGGILGYATCVRSNATYKINNNENYGEITGNNNVAGIAGFVYAFYERYDYKDYNSYFEITYCNNNAEIHGNSNVGGIVGSHARLNTADNLMSTNKTLWGTLIG